MLKTTEEVQMATVRVIDGQVVLDDPSALGVIHAIAKANCESTLAQNQDRVAHFFQRIPELGMTSKDVVIIIANVDDVHGGPITEMLMPGQQAMWQRMRDENLTPYSRGLAGREGIQEVLDIIDEEAGWKLASIDGVAVVVIDHGVAEVWRHES